MRISHKEISEYFVREVLNSSSPNVNSRELRCDYAIKDGDNTICFEAEALVSKAESDLHILGHLINIAAQNKEGDKISELYWLIGEAHKNSFERKVKRCTEKILKVVSNEKYLPDQKFEIIPPDKIELAIKG